MHDHLLGWSALVLVCVGLLLMFLRLSWSGESLLGLAFVALIGCMGPKPRLARVAVILYGAAIVVLELPSSYQLGLPWLLTWIALMVVGSLELLMSFGVELVEGSFDT